VLAERQMGNAAAGELEHVEGDEHDRHRTVALEHPSAEPREARPAVVAERDEFAVEHRVRRSFASSGRCGVMFQPRRLRTWNRSPARTSARDPSSLSSYDQPGSAGRRPERASFG